MYLRQSFSQGSDWFMTMNGRARKYNWTCARRRFDATTFARRRFDATAFVRRRIDTTLTRTHFTQEKIRKEGVGRTLERGGGREEEKKEERLMKQSKKK